MKSLDDTTAQGQGTACGVQTAPAPAENISLFKRRQFTARKRERGKKGKKRKTRLPESRAARLDLRAGQSYAAVALIYSQPRSADIRWRHSAEKLTPDPCSCGGGGGETLTSRPPDHLTGPTGGVWGCGVVPILLSATQYQSELPQQAGCPGCEIQGDPGGQTPLINP